MSITRRRVVRLGCALAVLTSVAAVCNPPLDIEGLEPQLQQQVEEFTGQSFRSVSCPDDVQPEAGGTFDCEAVDEAGATFTIRVSQSDDQGNVSWELIGAAPEPGA
ncbi:MAG: DUF4333 domain-containing protein [Actinomycetota bacterium]